MDGAHASRSKENIYMSSWGSSIGWRPCIMKQRLLVRIPLSPLLCGHVKKRKKKKKKNIYTVGKNIDLLGRWAQPEN